MNNWKGSEQNLYRDSIRQIKKGKSKKVIEEKYPADNCCHELDKHIVNKYFTINLNKSNEVTAFMKWHWKYIPKTYEINDKITGMKH